MKKRKQFAIDNAVGLKEIVQAIYDEGWDWTAIDILEIRRVNDTQGVITIEPKRGK